MEEKATLGVIIGNRGVFPGHLAGEGRKEIINILEKEGIEVVTVKSEETKYGAIENFQEAKKCAALFREYRDKIDGILISLPNFGDERAVADSIKMSKLYVPVLVHAYADDLNKMGIENRSDSFCGKFSVCSNLIQYGIPFSLTESHTVSPSSEKFLDELRRFVRVCRVVKNVQGARIGAIGARTVPFKTVRYSEKLLEESGISVDEPQKYFIYYIVVGTFLALSVFVGRRAGCHTICWMAPFMILGRKLRNLGGWPALRLKAETSRCINCKRCTQNCPMSLDVNGLVQKGAMEHGECVLCGTCVDVCPKDVIHYAFSKEG